MSWQEGDPYWGLWKGPWYRVTRALLGSAFPVPQGPELPKSAAGASPSLLEVSTDFTSICEHGSAHSLLSKRLLHQLHQRLCRGIATPSGITRGLAGMFLTPPSTRESPLHLHQVTTSCCDSLSPGTHGPHRCPSSARAAAAMGLMPHGDVEWGRMRHSPVSPVLCCFGSKTEACGACSPHGSSPPLPGPPRDGCAAGQRLLLKD